MKLNIDLSKLTIENRGDICLALDIPHDIADKVTAYLRSATEENIRKELMNGLAGVSKHLDLSAVMFNDNMLLVVNEMLPLDKPNNIFYFGLVMGAIKTGVLQSLHKSGIISS